MLKSALLGSAVAALAFASAQAMPLSGNIGGTSPSLELVAGGCGPGWHRGPGGGCVRNVVVAPGPVVVAPLPYWRGPGWRYYRGCWRGPYGRVHCD